MGKNTPPDGCVYGSLPLFFQRFFPFFTYDAQGERFGAYQKGLYYDADLNVLDKEQEIRMIQRLGPVAEIFME